MCSLLNKALDECISRVMNRRYKPVGEEHIQKKVVRLVRLFFLPGHIRNAGNRLQISPVRFIEMTSMDLNPCRNSPALQY